MTGEQPADLSGNWAGSFIGALLFPAVPVLGLYAVLAAIFNWSWWLLPIGVIVFLIATFHLRTKGNVFVSEAGITMKLNRRRNFVPWANVVSVTPRRMAGWLIFVEPQRIGGKDRPAFPFVCLDPWWQRRPASKAIIDRVGLTSSEPGPVQREL